MLDELNNSIKVPSRSKSAYARYIGAIVSHGGTVDVWLNSIINNGSLDPMKDALDMFDNHFRGVKLANKTIYNYRTAYRKLSQAVLGLFYAYVWAFDNMILSSRVSLCDLVANNALFASPKVVLDVMNGIDGSRNNIGKGNVYASWDCMQHVRYRAPKGTSVTLTVAGMPTTCVADDNTTANQSIKRAILSSRGYRSIHNFSQFKDYEVCHIWDNPKDPRYYASIANLVLIPRAFAGLTDHCPPIKDLLKYRAWDLFNGTGVTLPITSAPMMPSNYSSIVWRI